MSPRQVKAPTCLIYFAVSRTFCIWPAHLDDWLWRDGRQVRDDGGEV
jgi:hypothetical protein